MSLDKDMHVSREDEEVLTESSEDIALKLRNEVSVQIDWEAYFKDFCKAHGEPEQYGGRLIFPDGWSYGLQDYVGPEWPPPKEERELLRVQTIYWSLRVSRLKIQFSTLQQLIESRREILEHRSLPIKCKQTSVDDSSGKVNYITTPLETRTLKLRLEGLKSKYEEALEQHAAHALWIRGTTK